MATSVVLQKVEKRYGAMDVIHGIDLTIDPGEFVVFVGPSGCGKSTLLRMIAGLEEISGGALLLDSERMNEVAPAKRGIAMVFQSYALYPHMSVYKNLAFGLETAGYKKADIQPKVKRAAEILQIEKLLERKPKALSGGQRQRVAIGRAIVREPRIFLFDEPLSNLDAELRVQMRVEISRLHRSLGNTMIYVTHDQVEAMTMADKIVVLNSGRIEQVGAPLDLYNNPANRFVAGFIGSPKMNFLKARIEQVGETETSIHVCGNSVHLPRRLKGEAGQEVTFGIRPEHLSLAEGAITLSTVNVDLVENLGGATMLYTTTPDNQLLTVALDGQQKVERGTNVTTFFDPVRCHVFDGSGKTI
ncbi:ABC transporter ATP-binding protein [Rhizobium leguminosarum bv. trifolii CB782]|uniref:ABC transporter ATP-binding protein n=1 Tax=Rhizobium hidalgonense TaxID=1538159 RepID=A0ABX4JQ60_9HYPH|nr:sn-glycerol-3-phosphate ABC transporter ATP-binding protein UgpC [Rhizobium hidalgonense]AHG47555.1 ABC transporter ATP-binding protein [Rhizobium leguminosarum bv. trifolii CB782]MDR9813649.1 sn-glycerol-3-phosphate ABC transporter ATP-binding protein UgpC [Rhizobium hidalgonense]PDT22200.1 ABC transporter ATP-binding protein [Rhizobium hidalgonense]PON08864.1 sugar ABC transporter ATP-binding protein [Rhizobium hidalgonense]